MSSMQSIPEKHREEQMIIKAKTDDFLSKGGKIKVCLLNESANVQVKISDFAINGRNDGRRKPTKPNSVKG